MCTVFATTCTTHSGDCVFFNEMFCPQVAHTKTHTCAWYTLNGHVTEIFKILQKSQPLTSWGALILFRPALIAKYENISL